MIIKRITLKNFKSYESTTTFNLSVNNNQNIILIGGENGAGKSTIFQAIKLCIYGSTAYGYLGQNYHYNELVKNYINNNAFTSDTISSYVEIDLCFGNNPDDFYTLKRSWSYENEKINEVFTVTKDADLLSDEKLDHFNQQLKSTLPPSLFNFFFFDGEELGNFFTDKSNRLNMKESVLELFNFNTFVTIQKQLKSYQKQQTKNNTELEAIQSEYESLSEKVQNIQDQKVNLEESIERAMIRLDHLSAQKKKLEEEFHQRGGLLEKEQSQVTSTITKLEAERVEINNKIKEFCTNELPFLLISNQLVQLSSHIKQEQQLEQYNLIKQKLNSKILLESIQTVLQTSISSEDSISIQNHLLAGMFNENEINKISQFLCLSNEQSNSVLALCNTLIQSKEQLFKNISSYYKRLESIASEIKSLKKKLNSNVSNDQMFTYINSINEINNETAILNSQIQSNEEEITRIQDELQGLQSLHLRTKSKMIELLQNNNITNLSLDLVNYFEELLKNVTNKKLRLIEKEFLVIFSQIIRKNNFITDIKLDENFNATLYNTRDYTVTELINICNNIGVNNLTYKYGQLFIDDLCSYLSTNEENLLLTLWGQSGQSILSLRTKVNINALSSGEKQVYVLCLIWAILKVSDVNIPFIIDTPYARIDSTHRHALTTIYLPKISEQVIILSTNEEIDEELYKVIKPYVANEYLLLYDTEHHRTTIKNAYFEV